MSPHNGPVDALSSDCRGSSQDATRTAALVIGIVLFILLITALPVVVSMGSLFGGGGMMGGTTGMMGGMMSVMWLLPVLLPIAIFASVGVFVWQSVGRSDGTQQSEPAAGDPLETLERRYVDGEIDLAEYETRLEQLFDIDADENIHPEVTRLAIQYARSDIDRAALDERIDRLQSEELSVRSADVDELLEMLTHTDGSATAPAVGQPADQPTAVQRLRRRYADGELSHEEYEQRLSTLRETATEHD